MTPSELLSQVSNKLSSMTAMEFTDSGTEYSVVVNIPVTAIRTSETSPA